MKPSIIPESCCLPPSHEHHHRGFDYVFWGSFGVIVAALLTDALQMGPQWLQMFSMGVADLLKAMWWGIASGLVFVGLMSQVPREYFQAMMGRGDTVGGVFRAVIAGMLLDLCSHGILLIAAKLYERGASLAQIMAFLVASPWNSLSLILILISLIGLKWTLLFVAASFLVAFTTGLVYLWLVKSGFLPANPNAAETPENFSVIADAKARLKNFRPNAAFFKAVGHAILKDGQMLVRWLMLGICIAAALHAFVPQDQFAGLFGPSLAGLAITLIATTALVVCSEGSAPIAAVILRVASAPGNAFVFLMAGVSTDYAGIMVLRQATGSWKTALSLPLVTVPQILLLGWLMNQFQ